MLNHITIMGRLTRDPELKTTQSGASVCSFSVACEHDFKDKATGERGVDFIDCTAWRQTAEHISKYFGKGRMIAVDGRLQIRGWTDNEGNKRRTAEIVVNQAYFADSKPSSSGDSGSYASNDPHYGTAGSAMPAASVMAPIGDDDGELPF